MHYTYFLNIKCKDNFQNGQILFVVKKNKTKQTWIFLFHFFLHFLNSVENPFL